MTNAKSTLHSSTVLLALTGLALVQGVLAQYGGSGGRKSQTLALPLEMIFNQPMMAEPKAYKPVNMNMGQVRGSGYGSTKGGGKKQSGPSQMSYQSGTSKMTYKSGTEAMPVKAAVQSSHSVDYREVATEPLNVKPQTILVEAQNIPLNILFQSKSSQLNLQTEHIPSQGSTQETKSEDEPHHLVHRVTKPIIQEVFEIITPYRKITQEIKPVQEEIQTIVSRAQDNKYEAVNAGSKYSQQSAPQSSPKTYQPGGDEFAEMMKALKMEIPNMASLGYQPAKQSRMQMYMNQLMEAKPETLQQEPENVVSKSQDQESLPLVEMAEPEQKEEEVISSTPIAAGDMGIGEEKEVAPGEASSTQPSAQAEREKAMQSLMFYAGGVALGGSSSAPTKEGAGATKGSASKSFAQTSNYAESNTEPTGY